MSRELTYAIEFAQDTTVSPPDNLHLRIVVDSSNNIDDGMVPVPVSDVTDIANGFGDAMYCIDDTGASDTSASEKSLPADLDSPSYAEDRALLERYQGLMKQIIFAKRVIANNVDDAKQRMSVGLLELARKGHPGLNDEKFVASVFRRKIADANRASIAFPRSSVRKELYEALGYEDKALTKEEWEQAANSSDIQKSSGLSPGLMQAYNVFNPVLAEDSLEYSASAASAEDNSFLHDEETWLDGAFARLDLLDKLILSLFLDIRTKENPIGYMPAKEIAAIIGVSGPRVSQMYRLAVQRLELLSVGGSAVEPINYSKHSESRQKKAAMLIEFMQPAGQQG